MKIKSISIILIAVFFLTAVSGVAATDNCIQNNTLEKQLTVKLNQNFKINLTSNPSTGYDWNLYFDPEYIQLINEKYIADNSKLIGSGGQTYFEFKALKAGETNIIFKYQRPWENCLPAKEIIYPIYIV